MKDYKVYIAAKYSQKEDMKQVALVLKSKGIEVTSSWLNEPHNPSTTLDQLSDKFKKRTAQQDMEDIQAADILVLFSVDPMIPTVRGGRHVEMGIAIGTGKPIYVIGPKENIFHYLPQVQHFVDIASLLEHLTKR